LSFVFLSFFDLDYFGEEESKAAVDVAAAMVFCVSCGNKLAGWLLLQPVSDSEKRRMQTCEAQGPSQSFSEEKLWMSCARERGGGGVKCRGSATPVLTIPSPVTSSSEEEDIEHDMEEEQEEKKEASWKRKRAWLEDKKSLSIKFIYAQFYLKTLPPPSSSPPVFLWVFADEPAAHRVMSVNIS
jgi:hypothetical protein